MTDIDTLIRDLERATEGNRRLDGRIDVAVMDAEGEQWPARYTTSLDAALTLVPEGWVTMHAGQNPVSGTWYWGLHKQAEVGINNGLCQQTESEELFNSNHQTNSAAIALCIAALKARRQT